MYAPYGSINLILKELKNAGEVNVDEFVANKWKSNKTAAWAVSNCYGKRMEFAKSLMAAGVPVDTYGGCFHGRQIGGGRYSETFYKALGEYKFYFSFENSIHCKDYFTEKFWFNGLRAGAVPIVWGPKKEDVLKVAPTNSFIHWEDFKDATELANYINYLANNKDAYMKYMQWRTWVTHPEKIEFRLRRENVYNDYRSFCRLCSILQADGRRRKRGLPTPVRTIKSAREAWSAPERDCHA